MYAKILVTLTFLIKIVNSYYLDSESNHLKPKLERKNVVNKGVWTRNKQAGILDQNNIGAFIFRANSLDVENGARDTNDGNIIQETPYVSSYVQRTRRSPDHTRKRRPRKGMKTGKIIRSSVEDAVMIKSKIVSDLKPTSVFNEYPYEVAILLNNESDKINKPKKRKESSRNNSDTKHANETKEEMKMVSLNINNTISPDTSKRSKKYDRDSEKTTDFNMVEEYNKTETASDVNKQERNAFQEKKVWKQSSPLADTNFYKVVPKEPEVSKAVTERGLVKVISMLTKTFKKIMRQHIEIKNIHGNLLNVSQNFDEKLAEINSKFEDFDSKYADMIQFNNKLKSFETEIHTQKEYFDIKQKEIHDTFTEFQEQQKKFLVQQRQFYAIQKLMLAQNEKINAKQNLIAQTQSQISQRQNNFARILKKAKQIINDNKSKTNQSFIKPEDKNVLKVEAVQTTAIPTTTISSSPNTESMKINLLSIPSKLNKLQNQDALIIKEKDEKQIDELVYKYYFNNTFIDALMKNKILNNYATNSDSVEIVNRSKLSKNKRDELETTVMFPVNNSLSDTPLKRERRWINHFSKTKFKRTQRLNNDKNESTVFSRNKNVHVQMHNATKLKNLRVNEIRNADQSKNDPFTIMATSFCNEIEQNTNRQTLKWCVEKAMRKLKIMEMNAFVPTDDEIKFPPTPKTMHYTEFIVKPGEMISSTTNEPETAPPLLSESQHTTLEPLPKITPLVIVSTPAQAIFFPDWRLTTSSQAQVTAASTDAAVTCALKTPRLYPLHNDELETNLQQFDLKPDTEGNVYYDGSVHISDFGPLLKDQSAAASDIMPGLIDSDSRVEIDPMTFDIQAKRRAFVRRINENILKQIQRKGLRSSS